VERSAPGFQGSRGAGLQPRTREIFEDLGVLDTVHAAGGTYPLIMRWDGDTPLGTSDIMERSDPTPDRPYGEMWMLPQVRTMEILGAHLAELGTQIDFNSELTGLTQPTEDAPPYASPWALLGHTEGAPPPNWTRQQTTPRPLTWG
jgi:2-polyprenyl-6-methoxyphenol hydroxylase-like FAD-dependent oxidoreductase